MNADSFDYTEYLLGVEKNLFTDATILDQSTKNHDHTLLLNWWITSSLTILIYNVTECFWITGTFHDMYAASDAASVPLLHV